MILCGTGMKNFIGLTSTALVGLMTRLVTGGPDSMTRWIIEKSQGFTDVALYRIS